MLILNKARYFIAVLYNRSEDRYKFMLAASIFALYRCVLFLFLEINVIYERNFDLSSVKFLVVRIQSFSRFRNLFEDYLFLWYQSAFLYENQYALCKNYLTTFICNKSITHLVIHCGLCDSSMLKILQYVNDPNEFDYEYSIIIRLVYKVLLQWNVNVTFQFSRALEASPWSHRRRSLRRKNHSVRKTAK